MNSDPHIRPEDFWIGLGVVTFRIVSAPFRWTFNAAGFLHDFIRCIGNGYRIEHTRKETHERE